MTDDPKPGDNRLRGLDPENLLLLTTDEIAPLLDLQYSALTDRTWELLAQAIAWAKEHKNSETGQIEINDDVDTNRATDLFKQLDDHAGKAGEVEEARKKVKLKPYEATKAIDAWFANLRDRLVGAMASIHSAQNAYANAKRAKDQARLLAEAVAAAQRAAGLLEEARKKKAPEETIQAAIAAEQEADDARAATGASAADLTRTRSAMGNTSSQVETWKFKVTDIRALCRAIVAMEQPATYIMVNESAVNALIRGKNGIRDIPGLEIYPEYNLRRRGA